MCVLKTRGDLCALEFLFHKMLRVDFTPHDAHHRYWHGGVQDPFVFHPGVPSSVSGWRKRIRRLEDHGYLKCTFPGVSSYEWTQEGLLAVNLLTKEDAHA